MRPKLVIYQFKLTLPRVRPPVWRRIEVPAEITLHRLAAALITAMGWHGGHMHLEGHWRSETS